MEGECLFSVVTMWCVNLWLVNVCVSVCLQVYMVYTERSITYGVCACFLMELFVPRHHVFL